MKEINAILEEVFDSGTATYEFKIGKYPIKIRNITSDDYLKIDEVLADTKRSTLGYSHEFLLERISHILLKSNNKVFGSPKEAKEYLSSKSIVFTNKILSEHKKFEAQIKKALEIDEVDDNFFDKDASQTKQDQEPKA